MFTDSFEILEERRFEKSDPGMYQSIRSDVSYDMDDPAERYDLAAERPEALAVVVAAAERHRADMTMGEPLFDSRGEQ